MPRTLSTSFRQAMQASQTGVYPIWLADVTHPDVVGALRISSDDVDTIYGGNRYSGVSFWFQAVTDTDAPPVAQIAVMNVDRAIGNLLLPLATPPTIAIICVASDDFGAINTGLTPPAKEPLATPSVLYSAPELAMFDVKIDVLTVTADLRARDYTTEQFPGLTGSASRLPGLYR